MVVMVSLSVSSNCGWMAAAISSGVWLLYIIHTLLEGVGEGLDYVGMRLNIALFRGKSGVRDISGILAQRCYHVTVAFGFQGGGMWFKFYAVIYVTTPYSINLKPHIWRLSLST